MKPKDLYVHEGDVVPSVRGNAYPSLPPDVPNAPVTELYFDGVEGVLSSNGIVKMDCYTSCLDEDAVYSSRSRQKENAHTEVPPLKRLVTHRLVLPLPKFVELLEKGHTLLQRMEHYRGEKLRQQQEEKDVKHEA